MRSLGLLITVFVTCVLGMASAAGAQSTRPTTNASGGAAGPARAGLYDRQLIARTGNPGATTQPVGATQDATQSHPLPQNPFQPQRVILALAAVIGLIVVLRFIARMVFPNVAAAARGTHAVRVLTRSPVSPKQQVMLVQVGRRVIVVGDCGMQMSSLAEISDADEVAALIGQIEGEKAPVARTFVSLFGRARANFDPPEERPETENAGPQIEDEAPVDLGLASAEGEIRGLMNKVRGLAQQLKQQ